MIILQLSLSLNPQYVSGKQRNIITWETIQVPCHEYTVSYRQSQGKNQYLPDCLRAHTTEIETAGVHSECPLDFLSITSFQFIF